MLRRVEKPLPSLPRKRPLSPVSPNSKNNHDGSPLAKRLAISAEWDDSWSVPPATLEEWAYEQRVQEEILRDFADEELEANGENQEAAYAFAQVCADNLQEWPKAERVWGENLTKVTEWMSKMMLRHGEFYFEQDPKLVHSLKKKTFLQDNGSHKEWASRSFPEFMHRKLSFKLKDATKVEMSLWHQTMLCAFSQNAFFVPSVIRRAEENDLSPLILQEIANEFMKARRTSGGVVYLWDSLCNPKKPYIGMTGCWNQRVAQYLREEMPSLRMQLRLKAVPVAHWQAYHLYIGSKNCHSSKLFTIESAYIFFGCFHLEHLGSNTRPVDASVYAHVLCQSSHRQVFEKLLLWLKEEPDRVIPPIGHEMWTTIFDVPLRPATLWDVVRRRSWKGFHPKVLQEFEGGKYFASKELPLPWWDPNIAQKKIAAVRWKADPKQSSSQSKTHDNNQQATDEANFPLQKPGAAAENHAAHSAPVFKKPSSAVMQKQQAIGSKLFAFRKK